jgi:hypothetical protein
MSHWHGRCESECATTTPPETAYARRFVQRRAISWGLLMSLALGAGVACGTRTLEVRVKRSDASVDSGDASIPDQPGGTVTLLVSYYRLGLTTRDGVEAKDAWRSYGFDLDGLCTTAEDSITSKDTCKRVSGSSTDALVDGDACRDNNFGSRLAPLIKTFSPTAEATLGANIKKGSLTIAVRLDDLAPTGEDGRVPGALFVVKGTGGKAALDGNDVLDVDEMSVKGGDLAQPVAPLAGVVRLVDGARVWSTQVGELELPAVFIAGATGTIPVHGARLEIELDTVPMRGTLGGWILATDAQVVVGGLLRKQTICPDNPVYQQVAKNVLQASDMPATLPHDTTKECEAISLGLGIEMVKATLGKVLPTPTVPPDPCPPSP